MDLQFVTPKTVKYFRMKNTNKGIDCIPANAICIQCGTTKESPENGDCIFGHDDWLEVHDHIDRFKIAAKKFGVTIDVISESIKNNIDIVFK